MYCIVYNLVYYDIHKNASVFINHYTAILLRAWSDDSGEVKWLCWLLENEVFQLLRIRHKFEPVGRHILNWQIFLPFLAISYVLVMLYNKWYSCVLGITMLWHPLLLFLLGLWQNIFCSFDEIPKFYNQILRVKDK